MAQAWTRSTAQLDLTVINAVQSLFSPGTADPWGLKLAADFVDFILWHDQIRYPIATPARSVGSEHEVVVPPLLTDIQRRDPGWLSPDIVISAEPRMLLPHHLDPAMKEFAGFAVSNAARIRGFLRVHDSTWIGDQVRSRSAGSGHFVFDVPSLAANPRTKLLAVKLGVPDDRVYYLLDLVLKFLIYAERADGNYYLTHPIRAKQGFGFLKPITEPIEPAQSNVPFRIGPYVVEAARSRGQDWFTRSLHEARGHLRDEGMLQLRDSGSVSREALRQLAARLRLPARLRRFDRVERAASVASAGTGLLGSLASASMWPAVVGSALTIGAELWTGGVPGQLSRITWLQWMLEWPLEDQASDE